MMLLNIIKLRYGDTPVFLEVGSIVNQYILERELEAAASLRSGDLLGEGVGFTGTGKYSDRPTITYNPLMGDKFSKSLLTPIPPQALLSLLQTGWNAEFILRICLSAINDLYNSSGRWLGTGKADKEFDQLLKHLNNIQQAGGLGARLVERGGNKTIIFFRRELDQDIERQVQAVNELLGLNPNKREYRIVYGSSAADDTEIAMLTRSMLDIISEVAQYIEVPAQHIAENRASQGIVNDATSRDDIRSQIFIHSSIEKPDDAFLTINYRKHWFYIEDIDFRSKRLFSFLLFLFTLAEGGSQGVSPVLTLPTG